MTTLQRRDFFWFGADSYKEPDHKNMVDLKFFVLVQTGWYISNMHFGKPVDDLVHYYVYKIQMVQTDISSFEPKNLLRCS